MLSNAVKLTGAARLV